MGNRRRTKKVTLFGVAEGEREEVFLNFLTQIYPPRKNNINYNFENSNGGTPDKIIEIAFKACDRARCFAWFDEDFASVSPLSNENREKLATNWNLPEDEHQDFMNCSLKNLQTIHNGNNRNPILIISQPVCVESLIILSLGKIPPYENFDPDQRETQISGLKDHFSNHILQGCDEAEHYNTNLTHELLEERRMNIKELDLLITMITK